MEALSQCHEPGILFVLSQPTSEKFAKAFHHWYDTQHGPARLRLGQEYFSNGYRYKTADPTPLWLAIYEMKNLSRGADPAYTRLREQRSMHEQEVFRNALMVLSRRFLRLELVIGEVSEPSPTICCISFEVEQSAALHAKEWYSRNIVRHFSKNNDCLRSRLFSLVDGTGIRKNFVSYLGMHDWRKDTEVDSSEISTLFHQSKNLVLPSPAVRTFFFYRSFSAEEYTEPLDNFKIEENNKSNDNSKL